MPRCAAGVARGARANRRANRAPPPWAPRRSALRGSCVFLLGGARERAALGMDEEKRHRRGRDALDARGLADGFGTMLVQLLRELLRERAHGRVVQIGR